MTKHINTFDHICEKLLCAKLFNSFMCSKKWVKNVINATHKLVCEACSTSATLQISIPGDTLSLLHYKLRQLSLFLERKRYAKCRLKSQPCWIQYLDRIKLVKCHVPHITYPSLFYMTTMRALSQFLFH